MMTIQNDRNGSENIMRGENKTIEADIKKVQEIVDSILQLINSTSQDSKNLIDAGLVILKRKVKDTDLVEDLKRIIDKRNDVPAGTPTCSQNIRKIKTEIRAHRQKMIDSLRT